MAEITESGKLIQRNSSVSKESDHVAVNMRPGTIESSTPDRLSESICIYKVPDHLRKSNEKSYTPQVISIGPIHHGNKKLQTMENYKVKYLKNFLLRARKSMEDLEIIVKPSEKKVRDCYAEKFELISSEEFVKMILHDAIFIFEYFLRDMFPVLWIVDAITVTKPAWISTARMQLDFLLLENQLPFFILKDLYRLVSETHRVYPPFIEVAFRYFDFFNTQNKSSESDEFNGINHFLDLIRIFYLPPPGTLFSERQHYGSVEEMYCASQLAEAGLTFKNSESLCYLDLKYHEGGVLEIPRFTIDNTTKIFARNLMALEQCHYPTQAYITDYFRFLDFLIDTDKDVGVLRRKKILVNRLGDNCATIVNNLCPNDVADTPYTVLYYELCRELVNFYNNPWNSWKIKLRRDLSTPWVIVTTLGAIFLLVLTLVQTVCTVISTVK